LHITIKPNKVIIEHTMTLNCQGKKMNRRKMDLSICQYNNLYKWEFMSCSVAASPSPHTKAHAGNVGVEELLPRVVEGWGLPTDPVPLEVCGQRTGGRPLRGRGEGQEFNRFNIFKKQFTGTVAKISWCSNMVHWVEILCLCD